MGNLSHGLDGTEEITLIYDGVIRNNISRCAISFNPAYSNIEVCLCFCSKCYNSKKLLTKMLYIDFVINLQMPQGILSVVDLVINLQISKRINGFVIKSTRAIDKYVSPMHHAGP